MDASRFDAWTRRRIGVLARGLFAATLGLAEREDAAAKKKKKRCRKLGKTCQKNGNRKCCGSLKCNTIGFEPSTQTRCCRKFGQPCSDNPDCCDQLCCALDGTCTDFCAQ